MKKTIIKKKAEDILAEKLCRCIKSVTSKNNEAKAIAICKNSVLTKKKLKISKFKCKKTARLLPSKKRIALSKI